MNVRAHRHLHQSRCRFQDHELRGLERLESRGLIAQYAVVDDADEHRTTSVLSLREQSQRKRSEKRKHGRESRGFEFVCSKVCHPHCIAIIIHANVNVNIPDHVTVKHWSPCRHYRCRYKVERKSVKVHIWYKDSS